MIALFAIAIIAPIIAFLLMKNDGSNNDNHNTPAI